MPEKSNHESSNLWKAVQLIMWIQNISGYLLESVLISSFFHKMNTVYEAGHVNHL